MKALAIAYVNVARMVRERSSLFFVFIFPMLIILVLGAAFGGDYTPRLGVVSEGSGDLGADLVTALGESDAIVLRDYADKAALLLAVERGQVEAGAVIPDGYDADLRSGEEATIEYVARPDQTAQAVRNTVESVVAAQGALLRAAAFAETKGALAFDDGLELAAKLTRESPDIVVEEESVGEPFVLSQLGRFDLGAYSQMLLFIFITSLTGSASLIQSRRLGVSTRMLSTPTPVSTILVGESLGRFGIAVLQGGYIMLGSALAFDVDWGDPLGALAILVVFSLGAAGTGMLVGSVFKNDQQAGSIGVMLGLGLAALGGATMPLAMFKIFSPTLYQVAHITPHAWGIEAYEELIMRGGTVVDILPHLGILAAFAAVMYALAIWRFRVAVTKA